MAAVLDAAVAALADDAEATMAEIARRAGVARATVYVHFPTREALIAAVTDRAIEATGEALRAVPQEGDPADALARMLAASWRTLGRYHALVSINSRLAPDRLRALHEPILELLRPLLERGRESGAFNAALPTDWMLTVVLELVHAASRAVSSGALDDPAAEQALLATTLGALSGRGYPRGPATAWSRMHSHRSGVTDLVHVGLVVEDLGETVRFLSLLGFECGRPARFSGEWIDRIVGLENVTVEVVMARGPDGSDVFEVVRFHSPPPRAGEPAPAANRPGLRHIAFAVGDVRGVVDRVREAGWDTVGEIVDYQGMFLLCYVRGPEGLIVELAERLDRAPG